jgi:DNA topoisomerase-1
MAPAKGRSRTVKIRVKADDVPFDWTSSWRITDFTGWQIAGKPANLDDEEEIPEDEQMWNKTQSLKVGSLLRWIQLKGAPKRTKASPRFTEATLIRELEKRGIGRPSTFASLVEVLFDKQYIEKKDIPGTKINQTTLTLLPNEWPPLTHLTPVSLGEEKQKLVPTTLGNSVLGFCVREFPQLFAYDFTAEMEERLDSVSKGEQQWKDLCKDTWTSYKTDYERLKDKASMPSLSEKVNDFGNGFKAVMSKTGPLLVQEGGSKAIFYSFPPDTTIQEITEEVAREWIKKQSDDANVGSFDGKDIVKKKGPYGFYLQCGDQRIPFVETDTTEQIVEKFSEKTKNGKYIFGPYTFGKGQYGPYMFKTSLKTKIFVSIPPTIDIKKLNAEEADALYKNGVEAKKKFKGNKK